MLSNVQKWDWKDGIKSNILIYSEKRSFWWCGKTFSFLKKANWSSNYPHLWSEIHLKLFSPMHFKSKEETHTFFCHKAFFCLFREAISRVCEAMPGAKRAFKKRKVFLFLVVQLTVFSLFSTVETRHSRQVTLRQLW